MERFEVEKQKNRFCVNSSEILRRKSLSILCSANFLIFKFFTRITTPELANLRTRSIWMSYVWL